MVVEENKEELLKALLLDGFFFMCVGVVALDSNLLLCFALYIYTYACFYVFV